MAHLLLQSDWRISLKLMMGMLWRGLVICLLVGDVIAAQYARRYQDVAFPPDLSRFFENVLPFPFGRSSDFPPHSFLGSGRTQEISMFPDLPPITDVPKVEVFCDDSTLIVVVDKRSFSHIFTKEELQLGDGCFSNAERPDKFVFSYSLDQCGTTHVMQDGRNVFTNSLHLNFKKTPANWLQTPSAVHISCMPVRSNYPNTAWTPPERRRHFNIRPMTSSWSHSTESNLYERGKVVNLQISAGIRPDQQLFIQSCFVSASPEPQTRPRHAVILNKGCATPVWSPHPIIQFVASDRRNVVNFVLNTSHLISEFYIHCTVIVSDHGVTYGSKSCNYNVIRSRWEELNGDTKVCDCCRLTCKDLLVKNLPGSKVRVSTGPFVIVDKDDQSHMHPDHEPEETLSEPVPNHTEMEIPKPAEDVILSGASVSRRCKPSLPRPGVVVVSQNRDGKRTLWLPGQDIENCDGSPSQDVLPHRHDVPQESDPNLLSNELDGGAFVWDANSLTMLDGWPIPPQPDFAVIAEEFKSEGRLGDPVTVNMEMAQDDNFLPTEVGLNIMLVEDVPSPEPDAVVLKKSQRKKRFQDDKLNVKQDFKKTRDDEGQTQVDDHTNMKPLLRAKVEFSKGADGSRKLSYEEEVTRHRWGKGGVGGFVRNVKSREPNMKGFRSAFLSLLRRMDKTE